MTARTTMPAVLADVWPETLRGIPGLRERRRLAGLVEVSIEFPWSNRLYPRTCGIPPAESDHQSMFSNQWKPRWSSNGESGDEIQAP